MKGGKDEQSSSTLVFTVGVLLIDLAVNVRPAVPLAYIRMVWSVVFVESMWLSSYHDNTHPILVTLQFLQIYVYVDISIGSIISMQCCYYEWKLTLAHYFAQLR